MTDSVPSGQLDFHHRLLRAAHAIARNCGKDRLDLPALLAAYLSLAKSSCSAAAIALDTFRPGWDWRSIAPESVPDGENAELAPDQKAGRLLGPLAPFSPDKGGRFTEEGFLPAVERVAKEFGGIDELVSHMPVVPIVDGGESPVAGPTAIRKFHAPSCATPVGGGVAEAILKLRECLESRVYGQAAAVRALADVIETAALRPARRGQLRGSCMVFGPHGCGKSEILDVLGDWVRDYRQDVPFKRVVFCEGYLHGALHSLRTLIKQESDPGFLVLGEFEKYDKDIRDVLLEGLSRAELLLPDKATPGQLLRTELHGWVIVLVGNVGRKFWGRLPFKETDILPGSEQVREALEEEAIKDRHSKSDIFAGILDRAFVDRVESFIPLCQLRYADAARILDREIGRVALELGERNVQLSVSDRVRELLVIHAFYKKGWSARQILRTFLEHVERPARHVASRMHGGSIECESADTVFNAAMIRSQPRLLVLDDEHVNVQRAVAHALQNRAEVEGVGSIDDALAAAKERSFDLLLLDMHFFGQERWREYLAAWRSAMPDVPVALFSGQSPSAAARLEIDRLGGVIGFVAKTDQPAAMLESVQPLLGHAAWQARLRAFERQYGHGGDQVVFDRRVLHDSVDAGIHFTHVDCIVSAAAGGRAESPVLSKEVREEIDSFLDLFLDAQKRMSLGIKRPKGLLLYGPPGTGKTMIARDLAHRMRCNFLAVASSDFESHYASVASERIQALFEKARLRQPCVVFIDEIDALAPKRTQRSGSDVERENNSTVATLLANLDGFDVDGEVFVIGATNREKAIDEALLRPGRLDRSIEIGKPGLAERKELVSRWMSNRRLADFDADWAARETYDLSAADIARAVSDSVLIAVRRPQREGGGGPVVLTQEDLRDAVDTIRYGHKPPADSLRARLAREDRERTAWHEAGHMVLELLLFGTVPDRATILPRGESEGHVRFGEEDFYRKRRQLRRSTAIREIATSVGGGVAEVLKFGEHSPGGSGDRRQALRLAYQMVTVWGMGTLEAEAEAGIAALAASAGDERGAIVASGSPTVVSEVAGIMREGQSLALATLEKHKDILERAVRLLLENEDVDGHTIREEFADALVAFGRN